MVDVFLGLGDIKIKDHNWVQAHKKLILKYGTQVISGKSGNRIENQAE